MPFYCSLVYYVRFRFLITPPPFSPGGFGGPFGRVLSDPGRISLGPPRRLGAFPPRPTFFVAVGFLATGTLVLGLMILLL